ncbi:MAG: type II toxin-antitoxin system mRNA interferase toxin, RelE/StbE family [bacterium]|nr:type II toxin-antitoxin system mRNA interferase toxin, RelE/StbE family [bacterium]
MEIIYLSSFLRKFKTLDSDLQEEVLEKIELFKDKNNHKQLKIHKLHGPLSGRYSFSVNYKTRIVFLYVSKKEVALLAIGDHAVYDK